MSDDRSKRIADAFRVSITQRWEIEYWSRRLQCTPDELRAAVKAITDEGHAPMVKAVRIRVEEMRTPPAKA